MHVSEPPTRSRRARPGALAIVHDASATGALVAGAPLPLVLAATRSEGEAPRVELVVKHAEALSLYNRTAHVGAGKERAADEGARDE